MLSFIFEKYINKCNINIKKNSWDFKGTSFKKEEKNIEDRSRVLKRVI